MTVGTWLFLGLAVAIAAFDWHALHIHNEPWERIAKPLVMVALIATALVSDLDGWPLVWLVAGLMAGLVGDVLLLPAIDNFLGGLAAFLLGHLAYIGLALWFGTTTWRLVVGLVIMTLIVMTFGTKITDAVQGTPYFGPVVAYVIAIGGSTALLIGTGRWWMGLGALLFASSDSLLGWRRFVGPVPGGRLSVMVTYHLGQTLIVLGALT